MEFDLETLACDQYEDFRQPVEVNHEDARPFLHICQIDGMIPKQIPDVCSCAEGITSDGLCDMTNGLFYWVSDLACDLSLSDEERTRMGLNCDGTDRWPRMYARGGSFTLKAADDGPLVCGGEDFDSASWESYSGMITGTHFHAGFDYSIVEPDTGVSGSYGARLGLRLARSIEFPEE